MAVSTSVKIANEFKDKVHLFSERRAPPFAKFVLRTPSWAAAVLVDAISVGPSKGAVIQVDGLRHTFENVFIYSVGDEYYYEFQNVFLGLISKGVNPRQANESKRLKTGFVLRFGPLSIKFERGLAPIIPPPSPSRPKVPAQALELESPDAKRQRKLPTATLERPSSDKLPVIGIQPPVQPIGVPPSLQRRFEASEQAWRTKELERSKANESSQLLQPSGAATQSPIVSANLESSGRQPSGISGPSEPLSLGPSPAAASTQKSSSDSQAPVPPIRSVSDNHAGHGGAENGETTAASSTEVKSVAATSASPEEQVPVNGKQVRARRTRRTRAGTADNTESPKEQASDNADVERESVRDLIMEEKVQRQRRKGRTRAQVTQSAVQNVASDAEPPAISTTQMELSAEDEERMRDSARREVLAMTQRKQKKWQQILEQRAKSEHERVEFERQKRHQDWVAQQRWQAQQVGPEQERERTGRSQNDQDQGAASAVNGNMELSGTGPSSSREIQLRSAQEPQPSQRCPETEARNEAKAQVQDAAAPEDEAEDESGIPLESGDDRAPARGDNEVGRALISDDLRESFSVVMRHSVSELHKSLKAELILASSEAHKTLAAELRADISSLRAEVSRVREETRELREFFHTSIDSLDSRVSRATNLITALNENCVRELRSTVESAFTEISADLKQRLDASMRLMNSSLNANMQQMQSILGNDSAHHNVTDTRGSA